MLEKVDFNSRIKNMDPMSKFLYEVADQEYQLIERLVNERKRKELTQLDISKITGMSQQAVSRIEKYGNKPSLTNLLKYMKAVRLDINSIFNN